MLVNQWLDVHAHFYPPECYDVRERRLRQMREGGWVVHEPPVWTTDPVLAYMDRTGIAMQMLSNVPKSPLALRASNDYGASLARAHPSRFGFLAALPTDDPAAALAEIERASADLDCDGFAVTCRYNETYLGDPSLDPVWAELDRRGATVFAHPDAYGPASFGRPCALIEVAFETARTFADMLYAATFRRFPNVTFVVAHCGGALPALSGRLTILGNESWVPNPNRVTTGEMRAQLRSLYLDTAATCPTSLAAALAMTTPDRIVYGSDCGVPCTTGDTMDANLRALLSYEGLSPARIADIGRNALGLFPKAAARLRSIAGV
jgi:predicted TIM-barrel fold metal-dependent hydrolase